MLLFFRALTFQTHSPIEVNGDPSACALQDRTYRYESAKRCKPSTMPNVADNGDGDGALPHGFCYARRAPSVFFWQPNPAI